MENIGCKGTLCNGSEIHLEIEIETLILDGQRSV